MACIRKRRGKWVVDYRDGGGNRRWKTFVTKRDAEDYLSTKIPESRQWSHAAVDSNITLGQYAERWLALIRPTIKPRTYTRYEELWRVHLKPTLEGVPIRQLHRGRIKTFLSAKLTEVKPSPRKYAEAMEPIASSEKPFARNTVRNIHAALRAMLKAAVDDGALMFNPAEKLVASYAW